MLKQLTLCASLCATPFLLSTQALATPGSTETPAATLQINGRSATYLDWRETTGEPANFADNDGEFYREELSLYINKTTPENRYGMDIRGRFTNDDKVDTHNNRLQYLRGFYETKSFTSELGDVAGSFIPYVFTSALKGVRVALNEQKRTGWQAAILGGVQKASWNEITSTDHNEQPDRWVAAINSSYTFDTAQTATISLASVRDQSETGDFRTVNPQRVDAINVGTAIDWRFNRYLTTKVDAAYMRGTENLRDDIPKQSGFATKIKIYTKPLPRSLRSNFTYEYVDPDFHPIVGTGAADRERLENDTSYYASRTLKFRLGLKYSRDNLDGNLGDTQNIRDFTLGCNYRPDFIKRGDIGLRSQLKTVIGRGTDQSQQEAEINFTIRPKPGWRYGTAYVITKIDDNNAGGPDQLINSLRGTFGWVKRFSEDHTLRSTINLDFRDIADDNGDQNSIGGKIDLGYDNGNIWSADLLAQTKRSYRDLNDDTIYSAFQARGTYHIGGDPSQSLQLTAEQRLYNSDSTTTDQTYTENIAQAAYLFSF